MIIQNQFKTNADSVKFEETPDGFLRCKARVLSESIMPYGRDEIDGVPDDFEGDTIMMYVPIEEISNPESLRTLEGVNTTNGDHMWLTPETVRDYSTGSVAGSPTIDGTFLTCDIITTDPQAIQNIRDGKTTEVSAAYRADTVFEPGEWNGQHFDAIQKNLLFNHIAIIPKGDGRAGNDIRILNKQLKGQNKMSDQTKELPVLVKVRLKNTGKFINTDEEGAKAIEEETSANDEAATAANTDVVGAMSELEEKKKEHAGLLAEIEDLKAQVQVFKDKIDQLLSDEVIEEKAEEMVTEQGEASDIIENTMDDDEDDKKKKEEIMNSLKGLRGEKLHTAVLEHTGQKIENMSADAKKGAFKALVHIARTKVKNTKTVAGAKMMNEMPKAPATRTNAQKLGY